MYTLITWQQFAFITVITNKYIFKFIYHIMYIMKHYYIIYIITLFVFLIYWFY